MEHVAFASAFALASKIRHKDLSARELLEVYLPNPAKASVTLVCT